MHGKSKRFMQDKAEAMRARVTEQGLVIPKEWLVGVFEVEIRQENNRIVIVPIIPLADDPLLLLGNDPITLDITDASTHHDTYLTEA